MSDPDKGMEWLEANIDNAVEGLNLIIEKMFDQLRSSPERLAMVLLLRSGGRKRISELKDELSLSRHLVDHHVMVLEKWGIVSSRLDDAPEVSAAALVRCVELTVIGENMIECLEAEG